VAHARALEAAENVATGGFYHHSFDRSEQMNLVRVLLPANAALPKWRPASFHGMVRRDGAADEAVADEPDVHFNSRLAAPSIRRVSNAGAATLAPRSRNAAMIADPLRAAGALERIHLDPIELLPFGAVTTPRYSSTRQRLGRRAVGVVVHDLEQRLGRRLDAEPRGLWRRPRSGPHRLELAPGNSQAPARWVPGRR
jgi:hypothetical protein